MTVLDRLTIYGIKRDHSNGIGFFVVRVYEVGQVGIGFQFRLRGVVYGFSIHTKAREKYDNTGIRS